MRGPLLGRAVLVEDAGTGAVDGAVVWGYVPAGGPELELPELARRRLERMDAELVHVYLVTEAGLVEALLAPSASLAIGRLTELERAAVRADDELLPSPAPHIYAVD